MPPVPGEAKDSRRFHPCRQPMLVSGKRSSPQRRGPKPAMADLTSANLIYLFPAPFLHHIWDDSEGLNEELRRHILARERAHPGMAKTNVGGWHSEAGKLEWCGKA